MEIKQIQKVEVVTDVLCDVCNQLSWSLECFLLIGLMVPSMMGKDMNYIYVKNVSFMP